MQQRPAKQDNDKRNKERKESLCCKKGMIVAGAIVRCLVTTEVEGSRCDDSDKTPVRFVGALARETGEAQSEGWHQLFLLCECS